MIPARLSKPSAPSNLGQQVRPAPPTPTSLEAESSGRNLKYLGDVVKERRQPDRGDRLMFGPVDPTEMKLPIRLTGNR